MNRSVLLPKHAVDGVENKEASADSLQVEELVGKASQVIAPLWPLGAFVASHPWEGMEHLTFEEVADRFRGSRDINLYPSMTMFREALRKGELNPAYLEERFRKWLNEQPSVIPKEEVERLCRGLLWNEEVPREVVNSLEMKHLTARMKDGKTQPDRFLFRWVRTKSAILEAQGEARWTRALDRHMIKWCKLFLDESQAMWGMPFREQGFYNAWRKLARYDPSLSRAQRKRLHHVPANAEDALKQALLNLGVPATEMERYLEEHLIALPGWAGMLLWRSRKSGQGHRLLTEYLAIRLSLEWAMIAPRLPLAEAGEGEDDTALFPCLAAWVHWGGWTPERWLSLPPGERHIRLAFACRFGRAIRPRLWLEAWEDTQEERLLRNISSPPKHSSAQKAAVQLIFCIDVRSEPFRRHLEREGPFETFGCAGFFGLPIRTLLPDGHVHASCPAIVEPRHEVRERLSPADSRKYLRRKSAKLSVSHVFKKMKQGLVTSMLLPEMSGPWLGLYMLVRNGAPDRVISAIHRWRKRFARKPETSLTLDHDGSISEPNLPLGFSLDEKVNYVSQLLKNMGLTSAFSPLVVVCGHESATTNNPYASALDCGACGGAAGELNARVFAELCNLEEVRSALVGKGIVIPRDTVFIAAEHITTVNELRWIYVPELSAAAQDAFAMLRDRLRTVTRKVNLEQLAKLPGAGGIGGDPVAEANRLAEDWSEIRPEWGLARNYAFVIGRRQLTAHCDLEGRVFLHSYDWREDPEGTSLANIVAGPVTVAQWINLQYYASTVAPHVYGSGNKATQTVTAGIGVMQGNGSDLLAGLPWQSVMASDREWFHSPLRLLVVIEAPRQYIARLLEENPHFRRKVNNGWLRLVSIDPEKGKWEKWGPSPGGYLEITFYRKDLI
ncbi:DUF2309 domain-containing protein [Brevibacillus thermoruber]|uniref:Probable inorganic carbon transporter subunit DabA n=1 Tax=Brevibacillus thermoruber TaxID=33942 RepID=A0A9X3TV01_9BACL|nr:DUF2309 domain-containing protein [Brevibacillus thermoruber]MDA5111009.1 DUF2309 domain-containing protein [Brevibacillus thermoruber]